MLTISKNLDTTDLKDYLRPLEGIFQGPSSEEIKQQLAQKYASLLERGPYELFKILIDIEYMFFKTLEVTRKDIVL